ncbi:hypothetical protein, partial [Thalassobaculum salexigens]|uniref:hypothetical protein n=1 Tax=Thalassobaculum salexigens TaxID=455360 RepID=UPI00248E81EE
MLIVEVTLLDRKHCRPLARLVESNRWTLIKVDPLPFLLLRPHMLKPKTHLELVSVVEDLGTWDDLEDTPGEGLADLLVYWREVKECLADDLFLVVNLLVI